MIRNFKYLLSNIFSPITFNITLIKLKIMRNFLEYEKPYSKCILSGLCLSRGHLKLIGNFFKAHKVNSLSRWDFLIKS